MAHRRSRRARIALAPPPGSAARRKDEAKHPRISSCNRGLAALDIAQPADAAGFGSVHTLETDEWDRFLDINLKGSFLVAKAALPSMLDKDADGIVNIASVEGLKTIGEKLASFHLLGHPLGVLVPSESARTPSVMSTW
jgi:hypothetical protein